MFLHRVRLFALAGFTVWVDASWLVFAALIAWTLAVGVFPGLVPHLSAAAYWWMAVAGTIGLFFSIVLHELSHSLVARTFAMPITGITLFIFGGVAELNREPTSAKAEFFMAVVGPLTSFALGAALLAVSVFATEKPFFAVLNYLGAINWVLAAFNLVPAFPLDGGRVLRAALWAWWKDFPRATRVAAGAGQGFGLFLILGGALEFFTGNFVGGTWLFFIGLFLHGAAGAARQQIAIRNVFAGRRVADFMQRQPIAVAEDLPIRSLIENYFYHYYFRAFPVLRNDEVVGCIMAKHVHDIDPAGATALRWGM